MRVHPVFWIVLLIAAASGYIREFILLLAAVTIHEMTHAAVGLIFHARVSEIIITPLGEAAVLKGLDRSPPWARAAVITAGPAVNLTIGIAGMLLFHVTDIGMPEKGFNIGYFFGANIALGLFNLLPAFPLDGGRLCQLILGNMIGVSRANRLICRISRVIAVFLIIAGLIQMILFSFNMSIYLIGVFIIKNIPKEQLKLSFDFFCYFNPSRRAVQRIVPIKFFAVTPSMRMTDLIDCLRWDTYSVFNVYFKNGDVASFTENELMNYIRDNGLAGRAGEVVFNDA